MHCVKCVKYVEFIVACHFMSLFATLEMRKVPSSNKIEASWLPETLSFESFELATRHWMSNRLVANMSNRKLVHFVSNPIPSCSGAVTHV